MLCYVRASVFDEAFFDGPGFAGRVREFTTEQGTLGFRVEVVTLSGERLDTLNIEADETGVRLATRDDRLVFLPYAQIAHVDVSPLRDHRTVGFQLSTGST
jgi:hypothetical protein